MPDIGTRYAVRVVVVLACSNGLDSRERLFSVISRGIHHMLCCTNLILCLEANRRHPTSKLGLRMEFRRIPAVNHIRQDKIHHCLHPTQQKQAIITDNDRPNRRCIMGITKLLNEITWTQAMTPTLSGDYSHYQGLGRYPEGCLGMPHPTP
ncbi:hypothetical protein BDW75DRAFT_224084 [Aspergillus navahoensis]